MPSRDDGLRILQDESSWSGSDLCTDSAAGNLPPNINT